MYNLEDWKYFPRLPQPQPLVLLGISNQSWRWIEDPENLRGSGCCLCCQPQREAPRLGYPRSLSYPGRETVPLS